MNRPDNIPQKLWDMVYYEIMPRDLIGSMLGAVICQGTCRAILGERSRIIHLLENDENIGIYLSHGAVDAITEMVEK